jgi:hypothetical protein
MFGASKSPRSLTARDPSSPEPVHEALRPSPVVVLPEHDLAADPPLPQTPVSRPCQTAKTYSTCSKFDGNEKIEQASL